MTAGTGRIQSIFQDARELQADALEKLAQGRILETAGYIDEAQGLAGGDAP